MPKRISAAERHAAPRRHRDDGQPSGERRSSARAALAQDMPGLVLDFHAAAEWDDDAAALERCQADIARGRHRALPRCCSWTSTSARSCRPCRRGATHCDAMVGCMSASEVMKLTRLGRFDMDSTQGGALDFLKQLRGKRRGARATAPGQMTMLRRLPQILRFIPGTAQDVRAYFLTLQYWLAGSDENIANLVRFLVERYADGPREGLRGIAGRAARRSSYPEAGLYHPRMAGRIGEDARRCRCRRAAAKRHRRPAGDALLRARRQRRPLRRRHRGAGGARPAASCRPSPAASTPARRSSVLPAATGARPSTRWSR